MAHSIGKTIAELRKEKGWTQVELAEKLQVSDKAVSKWEKDDAYPSVEFFPALSELFGVTIDYLMTGKIVDVITLDDMDDGKRLMYLIKKDDVNNFEKYNYHKKNGGLPVEAVIEILNRKSIKIFNLCAEKPEYLTTRKGYSSYTPVGSIYDHIDDFVKLACLAGNVDFLDYIKFKSFAIGKANLEKNVYCNQYQPAYKADIAYCIKQETLDFIFSNENIPEKIIDYMCSYCIFDHRFLYHSQIYDYHKMNDGNCNMTLEIIKQLYNTRRYTLLENLIEQLRMEIEKLRESLGTNRIVGEHEYVHHENARIVPYGEYFIIVYTYSSQRLGKAVRFPKEFIYSIVLNNDKEWANVFIEHNKLFNTLNISPSLKAYAPSDEELEQLLKQASKERLIERIKKDA
jgi:transcriptional regulator with XRE-family HTH domain